jgi:hypothetical protein
MNNIEKMLEKYTFTNVLEPYTYDQRKGLAEEISNLLKQQEQEIIYLVEAEMGCIEDGNVMGGNEQEIALEVCRNIIGRIQGQFNLREEVEILGLDEDTPSYEGYSNLVRFGNRYFRTRDAENYSSWLEEINKKEWDRLHKYLNQKQEESNE